MVVYIHQCYSPSLSPALSTNPLSMSASKLRFFFLIKVHCKSTKMRNFLYGYCFLFDTAYRGKISIFNFYLLECRILQFNMCRHCEMTVTIKLTITSIISHSYPFFFCMVRIFMIYSLSQHQAYSKVLVTTVNILYS